jgi:ligand-binding sensor domain-containing protein
MHQLAKTTSFLGALLLLGSAFGGDSWKHITAETEPGLAGNEIQFIKNGTKGRMWVGTLSGLSYAEKGKFTAIMDPKKPDKVLKLSAWAVLRNDGVYWVGHGNGVAKITGDGVEHSLTGNTVAPLFMHDGSLWALAKDRGSEIAALYSLEDGQWKKVDDPAGRNIVDLYLCGDTAWLVVDGDGVIQLPLGESLEKAPHHLRAKNVTYVMEDGKGRVWCGLWGSGLMVFEDGKWERHLGREDSAILRVVEDKDGRIWAATSANGLWRYDGQQWTNDLADEGSISLLSPTSDGRVWVSSQMVGGLRYWDGGKYVVSLASPLPIRCVSEDDKGNIWAGGVLDGVHILNK